MFAHCIKNDLGYTSCISDQDVWMKANIRPDGSKYYAYLIVYVDAVLSIDINPNETFKGISNYFRIKEGSIGSPKIYLGANILKRNIQNGKRQPSECYAMSLHGYSKENICIVESHMGKHDMTYPSSRRYRSNTPFNNSSYRSELNYTEFCKDELSSLYLNLIGMFK